MEDSFDIVVLDNGSECERITIRGDVGFLAVTPLSSLKDIIFHELGIVHEHQVLFIDDATEELQAEEDCVLSRCGVHARGTTVFVCAVESEKEIEDTSPKRTTSSQASDAPVSDCLKRLQAAVESCCTLHGLEKRIEELEKQWVASLRAHASPRPRR